MNSSNDHLDIDDTNANLANLVCKTTETTETGGAILQFSTFFNNLKAEKNENFSNTKSTVTSNKLPTRIRKVLYIKLIYFN